MAKIRRLDSKAALGQQRAELRRGARGKAFVGDDSGSSAARATERAKVHRMQELQRGHETPERQRQLDQSRQESDRAESWRRGHGSDRMQEPVVAILADLVADSMRLARTLLTLPFRLAAALRGHHPRASEA
jgi:hypothetical protein